MKTKPEHGEKACGIKYCKGGCENLPNSKLNPNKSNSGDKVVGVLFSNDDTKTVSQICEEIKLDFEPFNEASDFETLNGSPFAMYLGVSQFLSTEEKEDLNIKCEDLFQKLNSISYQEKGLSCKDYATITKQLPLNLRGYFAVWRNKNNKRVMITRTPEEEDIDFNELESDLLAR